MQNSVLIPGMALQSSPASRLIPAAAEASLGWNSMGGFGRKNRFSDHAEEVADLVAETHAGKVAKSSFIEGFWSACTQPFRMANAA